MSSHEVPSLTAFTSHSKSFLTSSHSYHLADKARFFSSPLQICYFLATGNVMKFLFTPFKFSFHLFSFLCCHSNCKLLCLSPLFLRHCSFPFPSNPCQPGILFICSRPVTQLIFAIQLFSQPVTICSRILVRKFLHFFFPPSCIIILVILDGIQVFFRTLAGFFSAVALVF